MSVAAGLLSQFLHGVLMVVAPPLATGLVGWLAGRMRGRRAATPAQHWRRILTSLRKRPVLADDASIVSTAAPYVALGATFAAAILVPSFTRGMLLAPLADLVLVAGLLSLARCARWLAMLDAGTPSGGMAMARAVPAALWTEPVLLVCALVLAAMTGRTNIDAFWAGPDAVSLLRVPLLLCGGALFLAITAQAVQGMDPDHAAPPEASGRHLALWDFEAALRLLVRLSLIAALFMPDIAAEAGAGPLDWLRGLTVWVLTMTAGCSLLAVFGTLALRPRPGRTQDLVAAALLLALLGVLLLFATARSA